MTKKILLSFFLILSVFLFVGCEENNNTSSNSNTNNQKETNKDKPEAKINDLTISLNFTSSFHGISYKYPEKAMVSSLGTYTIMDYMNDGEFVFRIAMYFFENKSLEQTMKDNSVTDKGTKKINDKEWHIYEGTTNDGKKLVNYAYQHNKDTYTISFIYDKDINNLIDTFMNYIIFK